MHRPLKQSKEAAPEIVVKLGPHSQWCPLLLNTWGQVSSSILFQQIASWRAGSSKKMLGVIVEIFQCRQVSGDSTLFLHFCLRPVCGLLLNPISRNK